jgi:hypothetical protein
MKPSHKYRKYYTVSLNDGRWWCNKCRWWVDYKDCCHTKESNHDVHSIKKLNKELNRLEQEGYKGEVYVGYHLKYKPGKGHLIEERIYNIL